MEKHSTPRFTTILSARANDGRPSDLEFMLRSHCQKLKVVRKLSGAHLLIKLEQSLAVRAYFACDLKEVTTKETNNSTNTDDFDDLQSFLKNFKLTAVFFILPIEEQRQQLDDPHSFYHRAQRLIRTMTHSSNVNKIARTFLLATPDSAIAVISSFANACSSQSVEKKRRYFEKQHQRYFLPQPNHIPTTSIPAGANHIREAISAWADRFEFPSGEADVIASMLGTLQRIGTADERVLRAIPLDSRSKECLMLFFGSTREEDLMERQNASTTRYSDVSPPPPPPLPNMISEVSNSMMTASSHISPMRAPVPPPALNYSHSPRMPIGRTPTEIPYTNQPPTMQEAQYHSYHAHPSAPIQATPGLYHQPFAQSRPASHRYDPRNLASRNQPPPPRFMPEPGPTQRYSMGSGGRGAHYPSRTHPQPLRQNAPPHPFPPRERRFVH